MKDAAELKNHVYDIVGALHSVHDELGPGINEYCYQEDGQPRDSHLRRKSVPKSANGHGRVSPCAKGKLFQIVVSNHQKARR